MSAQQQNRDHSNLFSVELAQQTDNELLVLYVDCQSEAAFNELTSRHSVMVLSVCLAVVSDRNRAEDAFQATFLALIRNARRLRAATSLAGWLYRVAHRAAVKISKMEKLDSSLDEALEPVINIDPLNRLATREIIQTVASELRNIPQRYREALTLFYFEQLSRSEIAERMDCSISTIKSLLQHGKRLLKHRLLRKGVVPAMVVLSIQAASRSMDAASTSNLVAATVAICSGGAPASKLLHLVHFLRCRECAMFSANSLAVKSVVFAFVVCVVAAMSLLLIVSNSHARNDKTTKIEQGVSIAPLEDSAKGKAGQEEGVTTIPPGTAEDVDARVTDEQDNPPRDIRQEFEETRQHRLASYSAAMISWLDAECSLTPQQKESLTRVAATQTEELKVTVPEVRGMARRNHTGFSPLEFMVLARKLSHGEAMKQQLEAVLTPRQKDKLRNVLKDRDQSVRRGIANLAVVRIDERLLLVPSQRQPLIDKLSALFGEECYVGLHAKRLGHYPFMRTELPRGPSLAEELGDYYARYVQVTATEDEDCIWVPTGIESEIDKALSDAAANQKEKLNQVMDLYISTLHKNLDISLTEKEQKKLAVFKKKLVENVIDNWLSESRKKCPVGKSDFGSDVFYMVDTPKAIELLKQPGWKRQYSKWGLDRNSEEFYQIAAIDYLLAMIDQEIWLRSDQREKMKEIIAKTIVEYSRYSQHSDHAQDFEGTQCELFMLADLVHSSPEKDVKALLSTSQFDAWEMLKNQFRRDPDNPSVLELPFGWNEHGERKIEFVLPYR